MGQSNFIFQCKEIDNIADNIKHNLDFTIIFDKIKYF